MVYGVYFWKEHKSDSYSKNVASLVAPKADSRYYHTCSKSEQSEEKQMFQEVCNTGRYKVVE